MADKTWKVLERAANVFFGGLGRARAYFGWEKGNPDVIHDLLHVQCKYRKKNTVVDWWQDTKGYSKGKIPVLVIKKAGMNGFLVVVHKDDLTAVANQRECHKKEG